MSPCRSVAWTFLSESPLRRNSENDGQECPSYKDHTAKQRSLVAVVQIVGYDCGLMTKP